MNQFVKGNNFDDKNRWFKFGKYSAHIVFKIELTTNQRDLAIQKVSCLASDDAVRANKRSQTRKLDELKRTNAIWN